MKQILNVLSDFENISFSLINLIKNCIKKPFDYKNELLNKFLNYRVFDNLFIGRVGEAHFVRPTSFSSCVYTCSSDWLADNPSDIISVLSSSTNEMLILIISVVRFPTTVNPSNDSTNSVMAAASPETLLLS